uniref:Uncharacterized protein n=1 Tax=Lepeophtheirus salmonis TaxID=72036 RepID=A0A0K2VA99_LEPSM
MCFIIISPMFNATKLNGFLINIWSPSLCHEFCQIFV